MNICLVIYLFEHLFNGQAGRLRYVSTVVQNPVYCSLGNAGHLCDIYYPDLLVHV